MKMTKADIDELLSAPDLEALEAKLLAGQETDRRIEAYFAPRKDPEIMRKYDEEEEKRERFKWL